MSGLKVSIFGKFNIAYGDKGTFPMRARKVQELFIYLLLFRNRPQARELLSEALWVNQPTSLSRKNLRQTLWHLQSTFKQFKNSCSLELLMEDGWIDIYLPTDFWLDTAQFEQVFNGINYKQAAELNADDFKAMQYAVSLYKGDLLEAWYQDWCVFERERFRIMYLTLLDKLVQFCEIHQNYDMGLAYGWQILRHDHAYERAHRKLMRLYFMAGDRTQALHQYERCVDALRDELGVEPSERTKQLYEQIRLDTFRPPVTAQGTGNLRQDQPPPTLDQELSCLEQFVRTLRKIETQVQMEIMTLEHTSGGQLNQSSR